MRRITENGLFLLLKLSNVLIQLIFDLLQRFFVFHDFEIAISHLRIDIFQRVRLWVSEASRLSRDRLLLFDKLLGLFLISGTSAS